MGQPVPPPGPPPNKWLLSCRPGLRTSLLQACYNMPGMRESSSTLTMSRCCSKHNLSTHMHTLKHTHPPTYPDPATCFKCSLWTFNLSCKIALKRPKAENSDIIFAYCILPLPKVSQVAQYFCAVVLFQQ